VRFFFVVVVVLVLEGRGAEALEERHAVVVVARGIVGVVLEQLTVQSYDVRSGQLYRTQRKANRK
jgi:hypothetical protein